MVDFYRFKSFSDISCRHAVSLKRMMEPYAFSMALHTGEDKRAILSNRKKIVLELGWKKEISFVVANQIHSDHIAIIDKEKNQGWNNLEDTIGNYDALITNKKNIVLSILTADCVPILLFDKQKEVIAVVHAGWRGSKEKILIKTITKMCDIFDCNPKDIIAGIGPSIGRCCYEVDKDVSQHFFDMPKSYDQIGDKYMLDLPYINKEQLLTAGLKSSNIEMSAICTACEVDSFFSYREEKGCSGRFTSMISLY